MLYLFDEFELDADQLELRRNGVIVPVERQVFAVLHVLLENRDRVVTKEELVEKVWGGRFVSDSAVSSRIKSARHALGDDGKDQRFIRTLHGQGFRCLADVGVVAPQRMMQLTEHRLEEAPCKPARQTKPSIAVFPFRLIGAADLHSAIGDAVAHDLITELARLRWLFVIARGSSFRFGPDDLEVCRAGQMLNAGYTLSGLVEAFASTVTIVVELTDVRTGGVLWADRFSDRIDNIHAARARIAASLISALEIQIPLNEAAVASLAAPNNLDAWSAYHLGLRRLHRFNSQDNAAAAALFKRAIALEPGFARASAGLSSTYFQSAFLRYSGDPDGDAKAAKHFAERGVELDVLDPFANFTMGRAFWLTGEVERSFPWLERSTALSPNYAQGFYARAWADAISERALDGSDHVDLAMSLSPLDPFLYAMLATRALTCLIRDNTAEAAVWADRAALSPGAHVLISLIAVVVHSLNKDPQRARAWADDVRSRRRDISQAHFFAAFPFGDGELRRRMAEVLANNGFF